MKWQRANGRYSITDGIVTLVVPHHKGLAGVDAVLEHLNAQHHTPSAIHRTCAKCGFMMGLHDKWQLRADGLMEHRHCDRPMEY